MTTEDNQNKATTGISRLAILTVVLLVTCLSQALAQAKKPVLHQFLAKVPASELVAGATGYGPMRQDIPVAPILKGGTTVGYAFVTSDFVGTTGYSGKPIHVMAAIAPDAKLLRAELVEHSEPIVLIGIPD